MIRRLFSIWDLLLVFLTACAAELLYLWLALHNTSIWKILPLIAYVGWALYYLLTPRRRHEYSE